MRLSEARGCDSAGMRVKDGRAPRNGMVSGCYPLDDFYKSSDDYDRLMAIKRASTAS